MSPKSSVKTNLDLPSQDFEPQDHNSSDDITSISESQIESINLQLTESITLGEIFATIKKIPGYVKFIIAIVVLIIVVSLISSLVNSYVGNPNYSSTPGISTSSDPTGLKAYSLLLNSYKIKTVSLSYEPQYSNLRSNSTLIIDSELNPTSNSEFKYLYNYVSNGSTLIICSTDGINQMVDNILSSNTTGINNSPINVGTNLESTARPTLIGRKMLKGVKLVSLNGNVMSLINYFPFKAILASKSNVEAAYLKINNGKLIIMGGYSPLSNQYLNNLDNAAFGVDIAQSKSNTVYFDDADALNQTSANFVIPSRFSNFLYILFVIGVVWILSKIFRLGPPVKETLERVDPRLTHVDALTGRILKTKKNTELIDKLHAELMNKLQILNAINATYKDFDKLALNKIIYLSKNKLYTERYLIDLADSLTLINRYLKQFRSDI
jgi:hypothetical protein